MPDDPRRAALEALFVVREEDGGRMAALTMPSIPSGGWAEHEDGGERQNPYGAKARVLALRDAVITEALRLIDVAAPEPGAVLAGIVRAEEHDRAALVRERDEALREGALVRSTAVRLAADLDEARATIDVLTKRVDHLLGVIDGLKAPRAAQLALFAPPAADPAGEAQRAAASGAAVSAIVGAAADAPAPEAKPRRTVTCSNCGAKGHNARSCRVGEP